MKTFPMFLKMDGRRVVIVGGGEQAAQKCRLMLKTEARIVLAWPTLDPELDGLAAAGRIYWHRGAIDSGLFDGAALAFVATECPASAAAIHGLAQAAGVPVNVVDQPDLCTAITPSIVDRDPVVVAIGTEGNAPVLARQIKTRMEEMLEPRLGDFVSLAGRLRSAVARSVPSSSDRRAFWRWAFSGEPRQLHRGGSERAAADALKQAIARGGAPDARDGHIALIGAGPGAADLLTLRAVQRLQEADVIFYDRLVDPAVLELARRDAERVFVGKAVGANAWPQDRICALITAEALRGKSVVRLKSGDPMMFGRAEEELAAARARGIDVEIVPGVTAASAAAAALGRSLTERGATDRVVHATGTCRAGDAPPDMAALLTPGTTLALYMAVNGAGDLGERLIAAGHAPGLTVEIVESASTARQRVLTTTLAELAECVAAHALANPAILLIRNPKPHAADAKTGATPAIRAVS
ncbi:siroheme synthase CysG [Marinibacterium sp. SX1]|uniref:siroheme synthase CysG n=1 Tax=Marinibacterium sp. SX1 TaxID=3388424 RepID=UPI003D1872BA